MSDNFDFKRAANLLRQCRARKVRREWMREQRSRHREYHNEYSRKKRKTDPQHLIKERFHRGMLAILTGTYVSKVVLEYTQASVEEIRAHFEAWFEPSMGWNNRGGRDGWQVDCVKPCCDFDLTDPTQRRICFSLSNLRPKWPHTNSTKDRPVC
jgi:hypothetical protein